MGLHYLCVYCGNVRTSLCGERASQIDGQRSNCDLADFHSYHIDRFTWYRHEAFVHYRRGVERRGPWTRAAKGEGLDD